MDEKYKRQIQEQGLTALMKQGEPKFTDSFFPYTSGEVGPYYIQSTAIENDGKDYADAIDSLAELIQRNIDLDEFDAISGGESRDWDFSNPVAYKLKKPHIKLYKDGRTLGSDIYKKRIVHVADLNNEGSSIEKRWLPTIKKNSGNLVYAFFFVDRMEKGVEVLKKWHIPNKSVVPLDDYAWDFLLHEGYIKKPLYDSLKERIQDRKKWAHNALLNNADLLKTMSESYDEKIRAKAKNILNTYPEIKDQLIEAMGYSSIRLKK